MTLLLGKTVTAGAGGMRAAKAILPEPIADTSLTVTPGVAATGYLTNPGMGYQGYDENAPAYPQTVLYRRDPSLGYAWSLMNPADGVYDWSTLDADLAYVAAHGMQLAFRIYTMRGESFGGHYVPQWAIDAGAVILSGREPDYRSRVYQQKYAVFVEALRARYDGNPLIAFIDIGGYGEFNQWYSSSSAPYFPFQVDEADPWAPTGLDGHARKHLVAMYAGGAATATGLQADGSTQTSYSYSYTGFASTQLLMPYNGLFQPTQMVLDHYPTVGIRNDVFGAQQLSSFVNMGHGATSQWTKAPVVFETEGYSSSRDYTQMATLAAGMGCCLVHDLNSRYAETGFAAMIAGIGYRYTCVQVKVPPTVARSGLLKIVSTWRNTGSSRAYPKMGQTFSLEWSLADSGGTIRASVSSGEQPHGWLPGVTQSLYDLMPLSNLAAGSYWLLAAIKDTRTGLRLNLGSTVVPGGPTRSDNRVPVAAVTLV